MAKLIVETGIDASGIEKDMTKINQFIYESEQALGRKLTVEERKYAEEIGEDVIDKIDKIRTAGYVLGNTIDDTNKKMKNIAKKVAMWGLAIFGVRSAYNAVRNAINVISSQDEQLKANIDYMKNAIAYSLEPVVRRIVEWAKQLMFYIGYIIKMWTGKNIFENANKSLQKADKSAKSLQKTLAGFDEMNILNDNGSVGVAGAVSPDFDLSALEGMQVPGWIDWIAKNKDIVLGFIQALIVGLIGLKNGWEGIMLLGIGITIAGFIELIISVINFLKDPTWNNFIDILSALSEMIIGVGIAFVGLEATNPAGWILIAIGVIGNFITKLLEEKDATERLKEAKDKLRDAEQNFIRAQNTQIEAIKRQTEAYDSLKKMQDETGESGEALYNAVLNGSTTYEKMTDNAKKTYLAYLDYKDATISAEKATEDLKNQEHEQTLGMLDVKAKTAETTGNFEELGETVNTLVKNGKITAKEASKVLNQTYKDIDKEGRKTFHEQLPKYFDESTEAGKELERELENIYRQYDRTWQRLNGGRGYLQYDPNMYNAKGGIVYAKGGIVPTIKLASGAIINRPGAGVPIGGERAPEGVIPLTDSQQMSLLGKAIGQNANIYVTTPVYVGNRLVAREMKRIEAEDNFAFNR